ncbi:TM2 domain-containing protein [Paludifilum halophilum]|uniref:TM2 domain-containing protein n=1 Tax=Paludifilum halophilum TaxID=1642702 RepID=A0A235B3S3_9BACL|nr:TM2 domain-containing protein [Paludifilum halophilum]OYD06934.1 hypothetical protein CHM34_13420 [Paludifilum halophilum]
MTNVDLKEQLDERQLAIANSELENQKKSVVLAYVLWFFLGAFGAHRYYAGKIASGLIFLGMTIVCWILATIVTIITFGLLGWIFLLPITIWWIVDAFLLHGLIHQANVKKERVILEQIQQQQAS